MIDEDALRRDAERGRRAQEILESDLWSESLKYLKSKYAGAWENATTPEMRESCWYLTKCVDMLEEHLTAVLINGQKAKFEIRQLVTRGKRAA